MLEAMGNGSSDAACLLYDLLSDKGPSSTMSLVMEGLERFSEEGSTAAMVRLGDALSRGALAEKDLERARQLVEAAYESKSLDSGRCLMRILWAVGTDDALSELAAVAEEGASKGDAVSSLWLGRVLMRGKGVPMDLERAEAHLRQAFDARVPGARLQLMNLLWKIRTRSSCSEMVRISAPLISKENDRALFLVGNAYYYGIGVRKDVKKAVALFRKAESRNPELGAKLKPLYGKAGVSKGKLPM